MALKNVISFHSWPHHIKRHLVISKSEQIQALITGLVLSLVVFLFVWRTTNFTSLGVGLKNLFLILINSLFFMFAFITIPKAIAILYGYTAKYTYWLNGLLVGFVLSFVSYGFLPISFPGKIEFTIIERLRHGRVFPGENKSEIYSILSNSLLIIVLLVILFKQLFLSSNIIFFKYSYIMGATILLMAIMPFPDNLGIHMFFVNRKGFYFWFFFIITFYIMTIFFTRQYIVWALLIAFLLSYLFKLINPIEKK